MYKDSRVGALLFFAHLSGRRSLYASALDPGGMAIVVNVFMTILWPAKYQ